MAEAFLHREQDIGVAARFDMDQPVRMQSREMKRRGEEVAPSKAPEDRAFAPSENAREENGRARIVGKLGAAGEFVERPGRDSMPGDSRVEILDPERDDVMTRGNAFDLRDFGANIFKNGGVAHGCDKLGKLVQCSFFVLFVGSSSRCGAAKRCRRCG